MGFQEVQDALHSDPFLFCTILQKLYHPPRALFITMTKGRAVMRGNVRGHIVHVAPRDGYERFVPDKYDTSNRPARGRGRGR